MSTWDERYQPADAEIVKRKAAQIGRRWRLRSDDIDELQQEAAMHVATQMHRHDPARGSREAFVAAVAKRRMLNLIEKRTARKRDDRRNSSYDETEMPMIDGSTSGEQIGVAIDIRDALARMPTELGQVFELRMQGNSERDLEQLMGKTRAQVRTLVAKLQKYLREAGLGPKDAA